MLELRGQNGLLEGSCVETCGMPSSHSASWRVHADQSASKMENVVLHFWDPFYKINVSVFFGGWEHVFFSNQVSDMTVFFLKLNTNQMPFEIFITHYLGTFILMRPSPWVGSPCWGTSAMPETTDRNMRISTGNGHTEVRSGCHKSDGHQRLGRAQTGWRVEVSGGFRRNLLEVFFSFFCFLFLDFKLWIF